MDKTQVSEIMLGLQSAEGNAPPGRQGKILQTWKLRQERADLLSDQNSNGAGISNTSPNRIKPLGRGRQR